MSEPLCVLSCTTVVQNYLYSVPLCEQFLPMAGGLNVGFCGFICIFSQLEPVFLCWLVFLTKFVFFGHLFLVVVCQYRCCRLPGKTSLSPKQFVCSEDCLNLRCYLFIMVVMSIHDWDRAAITYFDFCFVLYCSQRYFSMKNSRLAVRIMVVVIKVLPQLLYGPFSGTTRVSGCQNRISGLYGARED